MSKYRISNNNTNIAPKNVNSNTSLFKKDAGDNEDINRVSEPPPNLWFFTSQTSHDSTRSRENRDGNEEEKKEIENTN